MRINIIFVLLFSCSAYLSSICVLSITLFAIWNKNLPHDMIDGRTQNKELLGKQKCQRFIKGGEILEIFNVVLFDFLYDYFRCHFSQIYNKFAVFFVRKIDRGSSQPRSLESNYFIIRGAMCLSPDIYLLTNNCILDKQLNLFLLMVHS